MTESYKSPVKVITQDMQFKVEDGVYRAVQSYGVNVNKDELVKALQYDREQYQEGFYDGYMFVANKFYNTFCDYHQLYNNDDDALVRLGEVMELIRIVKSEVCEV